MPDETMSATFRVHVEPTEGRLVWWAETAAVPGLSVAADSLPELRALISEAVSIHLPGKPEIVLQLAADEPEAGVETSRQGGRSRKGGTRAG